MLISPIVRCGLPRLVGIVEFHAIDDVEGLAPKILLVDDSIVVNHERLYARDAIIGGDGYERKSADHGSLVYLLCVVLLGFYITAANSDGVQFVGPDAPVQNCFDACLGIATKPPITLKKI